MAARKNAEYKEEKWQMPAQYRIPEENRTNEQEAMLRRNDEEQAEWRERFAQPYLDTDPHTRARARASILIQEYSNTNPANLVTSQQSELADAYAAIGRFDLASKLSPDKGLTREYGEIWMAILQDDFSECDCPRQHKTAIRDVYSIRRYETVSVMKCSQCGDMNAIATPRRVREGRSARGEHRRRFAGLGPAETKRILQEEAKLF